jgi:ferric-dicitrate binding protein FerR (iron transport regulator)
MSAIPPPPIASAVEEAWEVRRESELALASLRAQYVAKAPRTSRRRRLGSLAGLVVLCAVVGVVAWRGMRAIASR